MANDPLVVAQLEAETAWDIVRKRDSTIKEMCLVAKSVRTRADKSMIAHGGFNTIKQVLSDPSKNDEEKIQRIRGIVDNTQKRLDELNA